MLLGTWDWYQEYPLIKFCNVWRNLNINLLVATCYENEVLMSKTSLHMAKTGGTCWNIREVNTVSAPIEPRGSIFQNGIMDRVQFKFGPKRSAFLPKYVYYTILEHTKLVKRNMVHAGGGLFKSEALFTRIRYLISWSLT